MSRVAVGGWVKAYDGARVVHAVDVEDEAVEFSFQGDNTFQLVLTERVLEECAALFPQALIDYRAAVAERGVTRSGA
ncbi:hypothetical protein [Saccharothrix yanglingensis]|uniref:hypothetical protein n=1 Tax=Saccharothrix yanglingensis TaxID=659496 RepID=UPI0027D23BB1|nr:hypothetical protein [Saccharothrix yanglingensis]